MNEIYISSDTIDFRLVRDYRKTWTAHTTKCGTRGSLSCGG